VYWTLTIIILLPVIPAFLLFKALPSSDADLSGPLKGFTIKLKGAFAGYFATVLLILATHSVWNPPPAYQVWEIDGVITDSNGNPIQPIGPTDIELSPPPLQPLQAGAFTLSFSTLPGQGGSTAYPFLLISHQGYNTIPINLDPTVTPTVPATWDAKHLKITIPKIPLQESAGYQESGAVVAKPVTVPPAGGER
jgi:hypothetical protein